ncbi:hypothetical protein HAV21_07855 [Paenarthrobacter sp. MSM-2-10-13]|uniref:hypothetical protein n=1 Tax=Micrococcaceae TaxID=1268 RepID=UPI00115C8047|nr:MULTISPECIES: hypothetical protein [Micrococcaceae]NHW46805.1 hypothetical protein [Paenarthrobacter sp. MSM-2-10-13]TQS93914.1 hypothetical protein EU811_01610 [Arthrobacter sp. TS-15]BCW61641.1 hypothetical protein StoSoilB22_06140 [Arthrobacter sp. StoSoilB22]
MAEKPKSMVLGVVAAAVFAGLGRMVIQKIRADRVARDNRVTAPLDAETRAKISDALRTPR